ncbi:hypothetical protein evm_009269 [Chilo suppressalis]|nr:hypothetical protein evm_009269 [Chilo suppressalis]
MCRNQSSKNKKQDGITFHTFPNRDQNLKEKWIEVMRKSRNEPLWQPTSRSVVCSTHFQSDDLYNTTKGLRRVKQNAYPKLLPGVPEQLNDEDVIQPSAVVKTEVPEQQFSDLNQPSTSCALLPGVPEQLNDDDVVQPSAVVKTEVPELQFSDLNQPSTSYAVQTTQPELLFSDLNQPSASCAVTVQDINVNPEQSVQDPSIFDTPRKHKLRKRVLFLETKLKKAKSKIKTLNQKLNPKSENINQLATWGSMRWLSDLKNCVRARNTWALSIWELVQKKPPPEKGAPLASQALVFL